MPNEFETRNAVRAEQGRKLIDRFMAMNPDEYEKGDYETIVTDAIANILHAAQTLGVDPAGVAGLATGHVEVELVEAETGEAQ